MDTPQRFWLLASALLIGLLLATLFALFLMLPFITLPAHAEPIAAERLGPVWPITETDMRDVIMSRLKTKLPQLTTRLHESLTTYRTPATPRSTTKTARTLQVDPSITLASDLTDHTGRVLASGGRHVNPLTLVPMRRTYLILNAADSRQLDWGRSQLQAHPRGLFTLLLTNGSLDQAKHAFPTGTRIFPAPPVLFTRFPIDSVPARLSRHQDTVQVDLIAEGELPTSDQATDKSGYRQSK